VGDHETREAGDRPRVADDDGRARDDETLASSPDECEGNDHRPVGDDRRSVANLDGRGGKHDANVRDDDPFARGADASVDTARGSSGADETRLVRVFELFEPARTIVGSDP